MSISRRIAAFSFFILCAVSVSQSVFASNTYLVFGDDVPVKLQTRLSNLISRVPNANVRVTKQPSAAVAEALPGDRIFAFGETSLTRELISHSYLQKKGPEAFVVRSRVQNGVDILVANGNPAAHERLVFNRGLSFAAYELLQQIGFRFFHPMNPKIPSAFSMPSKGLDLAESPRWPVRGLHLHTAHQIELTQVLQGWGATGPEDRQSWLELTADWDLFCEWMIAHRQNTVEWVLLASKNTPEFNDSKERLLRLKKLVEMAHSWGLLAGIDVGIVFEQQNMWRLLRKMRGKVADDLVEIRDRMKWLMAADFDVIEIESGYQEFRAPDDKRTIAWMNAVTDLAEKAGRHATVKVHVSKDQVSKNYLDPESQAPINFNFLSYHADRRLGVMPHTVQMYGLDDPAPTYGNRDFSEIRRYLSLEAGRREVLYYPEAAYWCTIDIDVPLFLASYGERRVHDLRLIASDEDRGLLGRGEFRGSRIQGQILFSSGFEWGYWLNNLVAMHASWDPHVDAKSDDDAYRSILLEALRPSSSEMTALIDVLSDQAEEESRLLIRGVTGLNDADKLYKRSGIAYLAGQETWDELNTWLADKFKKHGMLTQPSRAGFIFRKKLNASGISYLDDVAPLLKAMSETFDRISDRAERIDRTASESIEKAEIRELAQSLRMMELRSTQLAALYEYHAAKPLKRSKEWAQSRLEVARAAVDYAARIVHERERNYRVGFNLISGWGHSPTSYGYGYLWTAHSLLWWYRDEGSAVQIRKNFCFMNIVNPADNVFAAGQKKFIYKFLKFISAVPLFGALNECLDPSTRGPNPRARVRGKGFVPNEVDVPLGLADADVDRSLIN